MKNIVYGSPFKLDWTDKEKIIAYAKRFGDDTCVFKHPDRDNYNITHLSRFMASVKTGGYREEWLVWRSE